MTSERSTGIRALLTLAPAYRLAQRAIGAERFRITVVNDVLRPEPGDRVLDVGCGTADILDHFPTVADYVGFDPSASYVDAARERFGDRGRFVQSDIASFSHSDLAPRTLVMAIGVLHHLDDGAVDQVLALAQKVLEPGGRFVSIDPTLVDGQHPIARLLVRSDRGQHVRAPHEVAELVGSRFPTVVVQTRHDLLRPPYSHVIASATAS